MKLVSIIVPMYNCENTIVELLDSISKQTYMNFEVILVNDGSKDSTLKVIKPITEQDDRFFVYSQENKGAPAARNFGIEKAKGYYLYFCDADDILHEKSLEILVDEIEKENADIVISNFERFWGSDIFTKQKVKKYNKFMGKIEIEKRVFFADPIPGTKLYKKDLVDLYGLKFADVKIGQDLNFYIKYLLHCKKVKDISSVTYYYRILDGSISRNYKYQNLVDIRSSINDILNEAYRQRDNSDDKYVTIIEYIKLINYVGQLRKMKNIAKDDYFELKKVLCDDVKLKKLKNIKLSLANGLKIMEFVLIKYFNIFLKRY